jgi:hypothetical protein
MLKIRNLNEVRMLPDGAVKTAILARAELCHDGDKEILAEMEEEFNGPLGGDWFQSRMEMIQGVLSLTRDTLLIS